MERHVFEKHVKILAILHIVYAAIGMIGGLMLVMSLAGIGLIPLFDSGEMATLAILSVLSALIGAFFLLSFLPSLIGGIGLLGRRRWARILLLVTSGLNLLAFPIGTALGIYAFWVLWEPDNFSEPKAVEATHS